MDRVHYSVDKTDGKTIRRTINPELVYLDTSAWIHILKSYAMNKEIIIDDIANVIGNRNFRILFSVVNFLELISNNGDVSINFSQEYLAAIDRVYITSAKQPGIITSQEVYRYLFKDIKNIGILDQDCYALTLLREAQEQRKIGNNDWFKQERKWWDEFNERDRTLNLDADLFELSGVLRYKSYSETLDTREQVLFGSIGEVGEKKSMLGQEKIRFKGKKIIPAESDDIVKNARHRFDFTIAQRYGRQQVSAVVSKLGIIFPGYNEIVRAINKGARITISTLKKELPGLYWHLKIGYHNYYFRRQRAGGQLGDRNHATYIPYSNYFVVCDNIFIKVLKNDFPVILKKGELYVFKTNHK